MVQRARLAVTILLALVGITCLYGQEEQVFTPPRLLSEPVLDLPSDFADPPADVMILVEVKADNSASLIKILDGKDNLKTYIEELLPYLMFVPSIQKGIPVTSTMTIKLKVRQTDIEKTVKLKSGTSQITFKVPDTKDLYPILREKLVQESHQRMNQDAISYSTNYFGIGLNSKSEIIVKDGFIQLPRPYYSSLQHQMLANFREAENYSYWGNGDFVQYLPYNTDWKYYERYNPPLFIRGGRQNEMYIDSLRIGDETGMFPWSTTLTDIYGGLGDYEFNFAKGQILKNNLFGVKGFYTEMGFLFQNGWWQETISGQTSGRLFVIAPVKGTRLSLNYESYDQDIPSTSLLPGLQSQTLYTIAQKRNELYLKWALPWFTTGWQTGKERLRAPGVLIPQDYETGQLLAHKAFNLLAIDFDLTYQYNYKNNIPKVQSLYQYNKKSKHQGLIDISHSHGRFSNKDMLLFSEDGLDKASLEADYVLSQVLVAGLGYDYYNGRHNTISYLDTFYPDTFLPYPSAFIKQTLQTELQWLAFSILDIKLKGGVKRFNEAWEIIWIKDHTTYNTDNPFADLKLKVEQELGQYTASIEQYLLWNRYDKDLPELPELQGQARFKLMRDMGHNNALSLGLNLTGHTDYTKADGYSTQIAGSLIADAWLGVKITDLFEFQLMMKNIGDNNIFGVYPNPRAIMGTIHWFFLN
jgi:hypothetical protein